MTDRAAALGAFLDAAGWGAADRAHLAGDASDRRYERLTLGGQTAVLMDNPPGGVDDPVAFAAIARHLTAIGLSAPRILADDLTQGFFLLEDLGDGLFARLAAHDPTCELPLYAAAADALAELHRHPAPSDLPHEGPADWSRAAAFALHWYRFAITGEQADSAVFETILAEALARHDGTPRVLILRDFHAENLLWLPDRNGPRRVGLLDFQLGRMGHPVYDLVSLLQDARRDVTEATARATRRRFLDLTGRDDQAVMAASAAWGAQRALRILGVFARLCLVAGKAQYLALMPRVWHQLQANLAHPDLTDLARLCADLLPPPDAPARERIKRQCATAPAP